MNIYLIFILVVFIGQYLLDLVVERLNVNNLSTVLPGEFVGYYDADKYKASQKYLKVNTNFGLVSSSISLAVTLGFMLVGGFNWLDNISRSFGQTEILTGLIFCGFLMLLSQIIGLPFSIYHTFVIEQKFGFNRTTLKTFILDILKGWLLTALIGAPILALVLWFFIKTGSMAWIYCWLAVTVVELFLLFIAPVVIMPLFNKFTPLADGGLKTAIEDYAKKEKFSLSGVFTMDGSKRSSKSNAFFTGFGKFRRIVLFDTLIERHTIDELVSVLAHEIGHYKKRHIFKMLIVSIFTSALMFFILSKFINNPGLFSAFKMENLSIYASLVFFGFIYAPLSFLISVWGNIESRKHEYEADSYAVQTYHKPQEFIKALKKLSVDNLSNLTPHKLKVFLEYSHPPVLERIKAIQKNINS